MNVSPAEQVFEEVLPYLETLGAQIGGIVQLLKDKGITTTEEFARYVEQADKGELRNSRGKSHPPSKCRIVLGYLLLRVPCLFGEETQQSGIHFFRVGPWDAVWTILYDHKARPFYELCVALSGSRDRKDAIGVSLYHRVGTSMRATSSRKSSCQAGTHSRLAVAEAPAAMFQLA
jgi:hypothetical protein